MADIFICKFCNKTCKNANSLRNHERLCRSNPSRKIISHTDKWFAAMHKRKGHGTNQYTKAKRLGLPPPVNPMRGKSRPFLGRKVSDETKRKISVARSKWIRENPDKYPWKRKDIGRFVSVPCEKLKAILRQKYQFVEEFTDPDWDHKYSLDIAFPNIKFAIEVNGSQHYNRDGSLATYYQQRHDYLVSCGWEIFEMYYTLCFNSQEIAKLEDTISKKLSI